MAEHNERNNRLNLTRRWVLQLAAAGLAAGNSPLSMAGDAPTDPLLAEAIAKLEYLTPASRVYILGRGDPPPAKLSAEKHREAGLHPDTWQLEVTADPESTSKIEHPLSRQAGTALDWKALMKLAEKCAVRFLHVCTCTNAADPFHMTLWEGVPLREVILLTRPKAEVRRAYYYGYHNDDPKQRFQSSLPLSQILEEPPGFSPVILAYKMNGVGIPASLGGPVRMFVPGAYGNKSVKWLQHILLTNNYRANDTYAEMNNDVESPMKTQARFINAPRAAQAGKPIALTGLAQSGVSGLSKVQYCVFAKDKAWPEDDPYFTRADWKEAAILPPPENWGGGLPGGKLPAVPLQVEPATGKPRRWPMPYTIVHWAALAPALAPGNYTICCRTIDGNGIAQPLPRALPRAGLNRIQQVTLAVSAGELKQSV